MYKIIIMSYLFLSVSIFSNNCENNRGITLNNNSTIKVKFSKNKRRYKNIKISAKRFNKLEFNVSYSDNKNCYLDSLNSKVQIMIPLRRFNVNFRRKILKDSNDVFDLDKAVLALMGPNIDNEEKTNIEKGPKIDFKANSFRIDYAVNTRVQDNYFYEQYYVSTRKKCSTARVNNVILRATRNLFHKYGIKIAIGDISKCGGGRLRRHRSHRYGTDIDLLNVWKPDRFGYRKVVVNCRFFVTRKGRIPRCYDRSGTFKLVKEFIDADPLFVRVIIHNDRVLVNMINNYLNKLKERNPSIIAYAKRDRRRHKKHVHISYYSGRKNNR